MGLGGSKTLHFKFRKSNKFPKNIRVRIDCPAFSKQRAQQALALIEGLVEEGQLA